jgi:hypothetical protein
MRNIPPIADFLGSHEIARKGKKGKKVRTNVPI